MARIGGGFYRLAALAMVALLSPSESHSGSPGDITSGTATLKPEQLAAIPAQGNLSLELHREQGKLGQLLVSVQAAGGTAKVGVDHALPESGLRFKWADGQTSPHTVDVPLLKGQPSSCGKTLLLHAIASTPASPVGTHAYAVVHIAPTDTQVPFWLEVEQPSPLVPSQQDQYLVGAANLVLSPDGSLYVGGDHGIAAFRVDGAGRLAKVQQLKIPRNNGKPLVGEKTLVVSEDGKHLYSARSGALVTLRNTSGRLDVAAIEEPGAGRPLFVAEFLILADAGATLLAVSDASITVFSRHAATGALTFRYSQNARTFLRPDERLASVALAPDGAGLLIATNERRIHVLERRSPGQGFEARSTYESPDRGTRLGSFLQPPDKRHVYVADRLGVLVFAWNERSKSLSPLDRFELTKEPLHEIVGVAASANGQRVAVLSTRIHAVRRDPASGRLLDNRETRYGECAGRTGWRPRSAAFSRDASKLYTAMCGPGGNCLIATMQYVEPR